MTQLDHLDTQGACPEEPGPPPRPEVSTQSDLASTDVRASLSGAVRRVASDGGRRYAGAESRPFRQSPQGRPTLSNYT